MENVPEISKNINEVYFGTIDTWINYNLTKEKSYLSDVTNASRTFLYNLNELQWDNNLLQEFGIPLESLPKV